MGFMPIDKMWERIETARCDSDTSLFFNLLYFGEMLLKVVVSALVTGIGDDRERHRYRQLHKLVRADGLGEWGKVIDEVLTGPASQYLQSQLRDEQRELTQRCGAGTWQYDSVSLLNNCLREIEPNRDEIPVKVDGRRWFSTFVELRNKTRGHGALQSNVCIRICPNLENSIRKIANSFSLFRRPWVYLHRNLSGKYNVTKLTENVQPFDYLRSGRSVNLCDGVYVHFDQHSRVDLIESNVDAVEFFFPNGGFNDKKFELISYITGNKSVSDATPYMAPATPLPTSDTQGIGILDIQGKCFGNLPPAPKGYIKRSTLETELFQKLIDDRHPVLTLVGRGGIGKTSLAISVLHRLAQQDRFIAILWFSARDVDLLPDGPKLVKPHILTEADIANEFVNLMEPKEAKDKNFRPIDYLAENLKKGSAGPLLFVLDNFETVHRPVELFSWIDTYVRLPNKVLITTRFRDFKGDYPVEVLGMSELECEELVNSTSSTLGISPLLTEEYKQDLYHESDGHPYVIKVLLGEVAKAGRLVKIERLVAAKDEILNALFERTYSGLTPVAKRVFLTLCSWQSTVPQLALEAVLLRPSNEKMDVATAIDELSRSSFVEVSESQEDGELFLNIPLVASIFGKLKLAVSPMKSAVEADKQLLLAFGAAQYSHIKHGIAPRIERLFRHVANLISQDQGKLNDHRSMLEFIARKYPPAWLLLTSLYEEFNDFDKAKDTLLRYLESAKNSMNQQQVWKRLSELCRRTEDWPGEIHALAEMCQLPEIPFNTISDAANRFNSLFNKYLSYSLDTDEKQIVVRKLAEAMESRIKEGDATDCSRLAWLYLNIHEKDMAKHFTELGLQLEPDNEYCQKLAEKLFLILKKQEYV